MVKFTYDETLNGDHDWVEIDIGCGYSTKIDRQVAREIDGCFLHAIGTKPWVYAQVSGRAVTRQKPITLHRYLMQPPPGFVVDHKNDDCLDNRRSNLQVCTIAQNTAKRRIYHRRKLPYRGIRQERNGKWVAWIMVDKHYKYLGFFDNPEDAALAYNVAALAQYGQFARLNEVQTSNPMA